MSNSPGNSLQRGSSPILPSGPETLEYLRLTGVVGLVSNENTESYAGLIEGLVDAPQSVRNVRGNERRSTVSASHRQPRHAQPVHFRRNELNHRRYPMRTSGTRISRFQRICDRSRFPPSGYELENCSICLSSLVSINEHSSVATLKACRHCFHTHCLHKWVVVNQHWTCPICRVDIGGYNR
ncbi:hypothetical protein ACOME3_010036 [Neoechinorhynchus agilis]